MTDHTSFDDELSPEEASALAVWLRHPAVWAEPSPGVEDQVVAAITAASSSASSASSSSSGGPAVAPDARSWPQPGPSHDWDSSPLRPPAPTPDPGRGSAPPVTSSPDPGRGSAPPVTSVPDSGPGPAPSVADPGLGGMAPVADPGPGAVPTSADQGSGLRSEPIPLDSRRRANRGRTARRALAGLAVAAVAVVAALGTLTFVNRSGTEPGLTVELAGSDLAPGATARADIFELRNGVRIVLQVEGLAPAPEGSFYAAWVVREEGPRSRIPIGSFHLRGGDGAVELWSGVLLDGYPVVSVTLQSEDDPAGPGQPVLRGRIGD